MIVNLGCCYYHNMFIVKPPRWGQDTQYNGNQHNDTQHEDTQNNNTRCRISCFFVMPSVAVLSLTFFVVMLSVFILGVVAPPIEKYHL
jgi:hypothetical protein